MRIEFSTLDEEEKKMLLEKSVGADASLAQKRLSLRFSVLDIEKLQQAYAIKRD